LLAETGEPTISGAVLPSQRLGHEAARLLDELMQGKAAPEEPVVLEPSGVIHVRQSSDASALKDRPVHLALQYIREHAAEPFKIPQLAKVLCVSRRKLENDFLRVTGQTPLEAITLARIERAKQLLVETGWPVRVVAERSGFGTVRRLHQVFAIREKTTPAEYRGRFGAI
jgi:LacI family transcriptional regulator